jgi:predicted acylesterase/phospholipase RssA
MRTGRLLRLAGLALVLAACATPELAAKLARHEPGAGYRYANLGADTDNADDLFVILAFSGGGTRAAAFSFGVMEGLAEARYAAGGRRRALLDDVDVISSVSGGSFTAAYYALFRQSFFDDFPAAFLYRNIERALIARALQPWNWARLARSDFDRIHLSVELYDETVFQRKTFGDLLASGRKPYVILNATDMSLGRRFEFTQEQFDLLCLDLAKTPVAAGVAASSAFPGLLSPLTLKSYAAEGCGFQRPEWFETALVRELNPPERFARARDLASYQDAKDRRRYVHLLDGGLADNIGLRGPYVALAIGDTEWNIPAKISARQVKRVVVITANAKTKPAKDWDERASAPGLLDVLGFVSSGPMDNYSFDTVQLVRNTFYDDARAEQARASCEREMQKVCPAAKLEGTLPPAHYHAAELSFDVVDDDRLRRCLENLPTSFSLTRAQVDLLRKTGRRLLLTSRELTAVMTALDASWTAPDTTIDATLVDAACPDAATGGSR